MKNVTISLDDEVARWVRIFAARQEKSVSRLVGDFLSEQMRRDETYVVSMRDYLAVTPSELRREEGYPSRAELHER